MLAAMSMIVISCAETKPELPAEELYTRNFIKEFGVPDSDHDWCFATKVDATVSLPDNASNRLRLYTDSHLVPGTKLIADIKLSDGSATFSFDVKKGTHYVYAHVTDGDKTILADWYPIENGTVTISDRALARSRDGENDPAISIEPLTGAKFYRINETAVADLYKSNKAITDPSLYKSYKEYYDSDWQTQYTEKINKGENEQGLEIPELYLVNGGNLSNNIVHDKEISVKEAQMLFGSYQGEDGSIYKGVFQEGNDNIADYIHSGKLSPDALYRTEREGNLIVHCIWRGVGGQADRFGYYYYNSDDYPDNNGRPAPEEFWSHIKKYVILGNSDDNQTNIISMTSGLTQYSKDGNWNDMYGRQSADIMSNPASADMLRGAQIKLPYFGEDGNGEATYTWPANIRVGFFVYSIENLVGTQWYKSTDQTDKYRKFFFSNCANSYYLFDHAYGERNPWNTNEWDYSKIISGVDKRPYASTFMYNGRLILSMADGGNDFDLNDIVFILENLKQDSGEEVELTPEVPEGERQSWILACEDLGNTYDYDFNDIVLKITHVAGSTTATITPLAAGGTLDSYIYFGDKNLGEVHDLAGIPRGVPAGVGNGTRELESVTTVPFDVDANWNVSTGIKDIKIKTVYHDKGGNETEGTWVTFPNENDLYWNVPQMILLPDGWDWPTEQTDIRQAYPNFTDWTTDKTLTDWTSYKTEGLTYSTSKK